MLTESAYERPTFAEAATYIEGSPAAVVVDAAALTPGPLTNFDISLDPAIPDLRLYVPAEKDHPFEVGDTYPDPPKVVDRGGRRRRRSPDRVRHRRPFNHAE